MLFPSTGKLNISSGDNFPKAGSRKQMVCARTVTCVGMHVCSPLGLVLQQKHHYPRRVMKEEDKCTSARSHDIGTGALSVAVVPEDPSLWCFEFSNAGGMQAVD